MTSIQRTHGTLKLLTRGQEATMRAIFVHIKSEMGQAYRVAREAADRIPEMSELFSTSGQYDLLGKFYLDADQDMGRFVTEKIQTLSGVKDTYTLITFNAFGTAAG
jgi:DNA-binding Lrp family transcriptional regulator